jgi:hypothetical protein
MAASNPITPQNRGQYQRSRPSLVRLPAISIALSFALIAIASLPFANAVPVFEAAREVFVLANPEPKPAEDPSLWLYLTTAALLVLLGGVFAGLTIAYVHIFLYFSHSTPKVTLCCSSRVQQRKYFLSMTLARVYNKHHPYHPIKLG